MFGQTFFNRTMMILRAAVACAMGTSAFAVGIPSTVLLYNPAGFFVPYTFETGSNFHLVVNYWPADGTPFYKWADQGVPAANTAVYSPSAIQYGNGGIYVFATAAVGSGALSGHLVVNYCPPGSDCTPGRGHWYWADQGLPPGATAVYSPVAITYGNQGIYVFAMANNGHLVVNYWDGAWHWADHNLPAGATSVTSLTAVVSPPAHTLGHSVVNIFGVASNGHLVANYCAWNGNCVPGDGTWHWVDQQVPPGVTGVSTPSAVRYGGSGMYVFASARNGHLVVNYCPTGSSDCTPGSSNWRWADQGLPPSASSISNPRAITAGAGGIYVFGAASNGNLVVNYWDGASWKWSNGGVLPETGVTSAWWPQPVVDTVYSTIDIFSTASNGHLAIAYLDYRYNSFQGSWADLGTP